MKWSLPRSIAWVSLLALAIVVASALFVRVKAFRSSGPTDGSAESGGFSTSATLSSSVVAAGSTVNILAKVKSKVDTRAVVDVEVYSTDHQKAYQQFFENQELVEGQQKTYSVTWKVPQSEPARIDIVKIGIFTSDWHKVSHWNDGAVRLSVKAPGSPLGGAATAVPPAPAGAPAPAVQSGQNVFLTGANLPWYNWGCDFGCGENKGVRDPAVHDALASMLGQAQASELRVIRWWMFEGDAWQIARDASGAPTEVNPAVYADIDAALQLAAANGVVYDFVLFSGPTAIPSAWMTDPAQRAKLASALAPLFAHYRDNPYVWSWEVVNEPEWDIWKHEIQQEAVQATVKDVAAAVHGNSSARVTVGSAMLDGLSMWVGQGLDYYQAHWYDHMSGGNWCAICTDYAAVKSRYSLDAPLVIGEFYAGKDVAALQRETYFETHGYGGAWAWSLSSDRTNDHLTVNMAAAQAFASGQRDAGSPAGAAAPAVSAGTPTFKTGASGTPALGGEAESISIVVMSDATTSALVDAELYSPAGDKLYQQAFDNQAFVAGKSRTFTAMWHRPSSAPAGIYIVKVGVFSPGWGTMYDWNDHAADALIGPARP